MQIGKEITAGLTVGIVALPLALAFGIAGGATAAAGLYTAIIAGAVAGIFGGSRFQITGPTGAMSVVLVGIVAQYGLTGMLAAGLMAGLMQLAFGFLRLGRYIKLIPQSVIVGFTNGIAVVIFLGQVKYISQAVLLTVVVAGVILLVRRINRAIPASLLGLTAGIAVNSLFNLGAPTVAAIPPTLPSFSWPSMEVAALLNLLQPALAIALLGTIESLLSAAVADNMTGTVHNSDRELIGQGLGNIAAALFGGVPATGAIARTAVNIKNGGQTRLVALVHSAFLLIVLLALGPWTSYVPLSALSGILVVTCIDMLDLKSINLLRKSSLADAVVLLATMALTVFTDLVVAVAGGILLAALIHTYRGNVLHLTQVSRGNGVIACSLHGPLFFGSVDQFKAAVDAVEPCETLVLDFSGVSRIDLTGALALCKLSQKHNDRFRKIILCGLSRETQGFLEQAGGFPTEHIVPDLAQSLALAGA